jgi:hypothetical protein
VRHVLLETVTKHTPAALAAIQGTLSRLQVLKNQPPKAREASAHARA